MNDHRFRRPLNQGAVAFFVLLQRRLGLLMRSSGDVSLQPGTVKCLVRHADDHAGQRDEKLLPALGC